MNRRSVISLSAIAALTLTLLPGGAVAQKKSLKSQIVGLWKLTSHANKIVDTGVMEHPFGEHPSSYQLFTRGGHMMNVIVGENRKAPAGPTPTDAEKIALFGTLVAQIGTYKVEDSKLLIHYEATDNQSDNGTDRTYTAEITGNKLTLTASPFLRRLTGQQIS
jgi:hypothetical protein